jgi:HPt (histidine-containing phosphotransfer) domain-containing protein
MRERLKSTAGRSSQEFAERLNKLKQSFLDSLPERLSFIDQASQVIALESSSVADVLDALKSLRAKAHDLAGAAGTFGFAKLGALAYQAEIACGDLLAANAMPSLAERQMMGELLAAVRDSGRAISGITL